MILMKRLTRCIALSVILIIEAIGAASGSQHPNVDEEIRATWASVFDGHLNDAISRATKLLSEIDPAQDEEAYWRASSTLVEIFQELEDDTHADKILDVMVQKKIAEGSPLRRALMQYYLGRDLVRLGRTEQGEQFLRALTGGNDRQVFSPAQRAAAIFKSKIEYNAGNYDQSAIWMRRAVIGILIIKEAAPIEILDVLTEYAAHLARMQRPLDAYALYVRLEPIYKGTVPKHSPRYIRFTAEYLETLTTIGAYAATDRTLADLKEAIKGVDILAPSITEALLLQDLYQLARSVPEIGQSVVERLKKLMSDYPNLLQSPDYRFIFAYFALLGGNSQLADEYAQTSQTGQSENPQIRAYDLLLQSMAAGGQKDFPRSLRLAREGVEQLRLVLHRFESLSADWLPMLRSEERLVLGGILGVNADRVTTAEDKDTLFSIAQLLNSDRSKLGLTARISRQALKLDLQREDVRTRDRLKDLRDRLMDDAVRTLITRIAAPPEKDQSSSQKVDTLPFQRLEEAEDKILIADRQIQGFRNSSQDLLTRIKAAQDILRPDEALVLHNGSTPFGIAQICITTDRIQFHFEPFFPIDKSKQVTADAKLILAAVHAEYAPSPTLDESFPSDSAYRLYTLLFGGISDCITNKTHLLLATDPDLFAFPFNALLTAPAAPNVPFSNRNAAWLPKSFAISLLPSVEAIYQQRVNVSPSRAQQKFLGIGDPELRGSRQPGTQLSLRSLYVERGVADLNALRDLPPLPDSVNELRVVATALGAPRENLLLGPDATERALRYRPLDDYRVISFATHALVAGDVAGVSEPALVLTPGSQADPANDGLLTATEIANLDLDANLVILSACNTAAADGAASGRGLSGLANAFFFAGARSVAVTQWAVFSEVAQTLGAGLITRSIGPDGVGVAEALRRTMVDFISEAKDDYRAHPRFWAAFTIAGDGAIKPLDGRANDDLGEEAVRVKSDRLTVDASQQEFLGVAKLPTTGTIYAVGRLKPAAGTRFAGSYLARLDPAGGVDIVSVDPAIAAGPISTVRNGIILLEYTYSQERKSAALFRLMDNNGKEVWRFSEDGPLDDMSIGAVDAPQGYILVSTAEDWSSPTPSPSKLVINLVSTTGELISRHEYVVADRALSTLPTPGLIVKGKNHDLIVVINKLRTPAEENLPAWVINPLTGSHRVCLGGNMTTFLDIDIDTLKILSTTDAHGRVAKAIKANDGKIFVAFSTARECRLQHGIELAKLNTALQPETLFKYEGVNDIQLWDFAPIGNSFVLSGSVPVQLPTTLLREVIPLDQLTHPDPFDPAFWERGEEPPNAFVLIGSADGTVLGDRVFPDLLNRSINSVVASGPRQIVGVGAAQGDRGWMVVLEPNASLGDRGGTQSSTEVRH
jgi:CHAT domain-containing protein